jgi:hypothetical protein
MNETKEAAFLSPRKMHSFFYKRLPAFNNRRTFRSVIRQGWRERIIVSPSELLRLTTTKPQQIILVILLFTMISDIKTKLYVLKLRATSTRTLGFCLLM